MSDMAKRLPQAMKKLSSEEQIEIEMRRQKIVEEAVRAADKIILAANPEEVDFLTNTVALYFMEKAARSVRMTLLKKELGL